MKNYHYPETKKTEYTEEYFGHKLEDPYRWLREAKSPEVLSWVQSQNEFTDAWFDARELEDKIAELKSQKTKPVYMMINPWKDRLAATVVEDGDYKIVSMDQQMQDEKLVLKRNDIPLFLPFELKACPANQDLILVSGIREGEARMTLMVIDCVSRKILNQITDVFYGIWSGQKEIVYYAATETDVEAQTTLTKVYAYHAPSDTTRCIYEGDKRTIIGNPAISSDNKYCVIDMMQDYSHSRFLVYAEDDDTISFVNESDALQMTYIDTIKDVHYFISREDAPNGRVLAVEQGQDISSAKVVCPEQNKVIENGFVFEETLHLLYMKDVCSELVRINEGKEEVVVLPDTMGTLEYIGKAKEQVYLKFETFLDKPVVLGLNHEGIDVIWRTSEETHTDLVVEQRRAASVEDGKMIPYFIVYKKGIPLDGNNPLWMYAYGGYNSSERPASKEHVANLDIAAWAQRGGVFVLGSIRGGSEYGVAWHEEGMMDKKKNCYYDFIGIAEQLIRDGWTKPEKFVISGLSNGGLLMSALVTMRPDLFGCVIDSVPHTDMIHFVEDDRGPMYITEYGNPKESKEMFEYMLSYSPYHNVREVSYPAIYIQTGECDNNVPPYHGKKFAARMQELNQSDNPVLLRVLAKGAHDRGAGEVYWKTISEMQLFAEKALSIDGEK
ncbi:prolyl oligopeptidase family serine peptidase [Roseburia hominis]